MVNYCHSASVVPHRTFSLKLIVSAKATLLKTNSPEDDKLAMSYNKLPTQGSVYIYAA